MTDRTKLLEILRATSAELPDVVERKMFGCEAFFTTGGIFALVWKTGRIGVKLAVESRYQALLSQKGAAPWAIGEKTMSSWVLVPPKLEEPKALLPWLREAHGMAHSAGAKGEAKAKAPAKAKAAAKAKARAPAKAPAKKSRARRT